MVVRASKTHFFILLCLRFVQKLLVALQTLCGSTTDNRSYRSPLRRHEFGQVQELLVLSLFNEE